MRLADHETQASKTKLTEACWMNYTRRHSAVVKTNEVKFVPAT